MQEMIKLAIHAAQEAGKILKENFGGSVDIEYKGEINLVTDVDMMSEKRIIEIIKGKYPDHHILTEESEGQKGSSSYRWIVDPLDGTTN
ncbi:MAG: inositol monophosphatase family protein, partial [Thermodesulfobacteriota bacterium]|nr:inositol monophosphatase family protein [Thermodesulfobacteriota bacterium]